MNHGGEHSATPSDVPVRAKTLENPYTFTISSAMFRQQRLRLFLPLAEFLLCELRRRRGAAVNTITDRQEELGQPARRGHAEHPDGTAG